MLLQSGDQMSTPLLVYLSLVGLLLIKLGSAQAADQQQHPAEQHLNAKELVRVAPSRNNSSLEEGASVGPQEQAAGENYVVEEETPASGQSYQSAAAAAQLANGIKLSQTLGNRHRYEQQAAPPPSPSQNHTVEPRAQLDAGTLVEGEQQMLQQQQQQQQQDPVIIDHRPMVLDANNQLVVAPAVDYSANGSTTTPTTISAAPSMASTTPSSAWIEHNQQQQAATSLPASRWHYAGQGQQSAATAASIQHPTSINSIINDQQAQASSIQAQPQMVSYNGQPASVILLPATQSTVNGQLQPTGGRRMIGGWLRGLSSMLANIFNRREHGLQAAGSLQVPQVVPGPQGHQQHQTAAAGQASLASGQLTGSPGNAAGGWLQLGPNAPHWLTQAQSALQQLQQQAANSGSRFANLIQSSPLAQGGLQMQPTTATIAIALPPASFVGSSGGGGGAPGYAGSAAPSSSLNQQSASSMNDLQPSGSSISYATIQAPGQQQQQYQTSPMIVSQLQQAAPAHQPHHQSQLQATQAVGAPVRHPMQQQHQQQQSQVAAQTGHSRFGRSSKQPAIGSAGAGQISSSSSNLPLAHYSQYASSN